MKFDHWLALSPTERRDVWFGAGRPEFRSTDGQTLLKEWAAHDDRYGLQSIVDRPAYYDLALHELESILSAPPTFWRSQAQTKAWTQILAKVLASREFDRTADGMSEGLYGVSEWLMSPLVGVALQQLTGPIHRSPYLTPAALQPAANRLRHTLGHIVRGAIVVEVAAAQQTSLPTTWTLQDWARVTSRTEHYGDFFARYPAMARRACEAVMRWVTHMGELLQRATDDMEEARGLTGGPSAESISAIDIGLGDPHRNGRSVSRITFADGLSLMYKPHSLKLDMWFADILARYRAITGVNLRVPAVVDKGTYGWALEEKVRSCSNRDEVGTFYHRQGHLLNLLHLTQATDIHNENILAIGDQPVVVDLETLAHPQLYRPPSTATGAEQLAVQALRRSVTRVGLLPQNSWLGEEAIDVGGLGQNHVQLSPWEVLVVDEGSDSLSSRLKRVSIPPSANRPLLGEAAVDPLDYSAELISGYAQGYNATRQSVDRLFTAQCLADLRTCVIRYVYRTTAEYSQMLQARDHPFYLVDGISFEWMLGWLWRGEAPADHPTRQLAPYEREEMLRGDVPVFVACGGDIDVQTSDHTPTGQQTVQSGEEAVREEVAAMGPDHFKRQMWLIQASTASIPHATSR